MDDLPDMVSIARIVFPIKSGRYKMPVATLIVTERGALNFAFVPTPLAAPDVVEPYGVVITPNK